MGALAIPLIRYFFRWHYSPLWALACRTIPLHFSLSITNSLHLLTPSTWRSLSTSSLHPFLGLPLHLVPSSSWVKIFLGILSSSILSRWPNQLILCPFIHFTIFSPNWEELLLPLTLQPGVGFGLSNNSSPFSLSITNSLHLLTPSTWRSFSTSSLHPFLGLPVRLVPSSSWVKRLRYPAHDYPNNVGYIVQNTSHSLCSPLYPPVASSILVPNIFPRRLTLHLQYSNTVIHQDNATSLQFSPDPSTTTSVH